LKALSLHEWGGDLRLENRPDPVAGAGEVLVRVLACGVGLTVLNCMRGDLGADPGNLPRIPGHELVGTVITCGPGTGGPQPGDLVAAYFYLHCGRCGACWRGAHSCCENSAGYLGVDRDGGYAELAALPADNVITLPAGMDPAGATVVPDAVATPVHIARRSAISGGTRVAVVGAGGGVGAHMVQVARLFGGKVAGLEANQAKLSYLESELGVAAVDSSVFRRDLLPRVWRQQADVIVDFLGSAESLRWSLGALAPGGRLVAVTTFPDVEVPLTARDLVLGEKSVIGSRYCGKAELAEAAALVARGDVRPVIGRTAGLNCVQEVHGQLRRGELIGRGALAVAGGEPGRRDGHGSDEDLIHSGLAQERQS
jgi:propanol-preferring alcohol dehydrogenase